MNIKNLMISFILVVLVGCSSKIIVPDVVGADESTAKTILTSNEVIPIVKHDYNDKFDNGIVYKMEPQENQKVEKNTKVIIYVSKGKEFIYSKDSVLSWYHVEGSNSDKWDFDNPYIEKEYLMVKMMPAINTKFSFEWEEYGYASINDTFSKSVPVRFRPISNNGEFRLEIPLEDLDVKKPTTLYIQLNALVNNRQANVNLELRVSW